MLICGSQGDWSYLYRKSCGEMSYVLYVGRYAAMDLYCEKYEVRMTP